MFQKLLKYEFQSLGKWYLALYGASIGLSVILGLWLLTFQMRSSQDLDSIPIGIGIEGGLFALCILAFSIILIALFLSTFLLVVNRFRNNIYGRQGYLTMTLPVTNHQLILSKLTAALIWNFLAIVTLFLCIFIMGGVSTLPYFDSSVIDGLFTLLRWADWSMLIAYLFHGLIQIVTGILLAYFAISIGQLFKDYRLLISVATYFGINFLTGIISTYFSLIFYPMSNSRGDIVTIIEPLSILLHILLCIGFYFGTHYIMSRKLNLQ